MIAAIKRMLIDMGYAVDESAHAVIAVCDDWYRARVTDAHRRMTVNGEHYTMERMGFGRRIAADDANLCEVIEINAGGENQAQFEFVNDVLAENRFATQYRRQLEMTAAEGTSAAYVWLDNAREYDDGHMEGGDIRLEYVEAGGFLPLTVVNDEVVEAVFFGQKLVESKIEHTAVVCRKDENGRYEYVVRVFDETETPKPEKSQTVTLGEVKPFAIMRTAAVNTIDGMEGYGMPKMFDAIPALKGLDSAFTALLGDIDTAEKITIINELLCQFDDAGKPITPNEQLKRRFVQTGEKLPSDKPLVHEITPEIRIEKFFDTIELLLSLLSLQFGFGTKKYVFDRETHSVQTATEYIGERQDMLQELNRQREQAKEYISDIIRAILWFANTYHGGKWAEDVDVLVEFDDSYITNKAERIESMWKDVTAGIGGAYVRKLYLMEKYNLDEEEAAKWAAGDDPDRLSETED